MDTLRNICAYEPQIDKDHISPAAQALLRHLLKKNPQERLSCLDQLKHHDFFQGMEWDALMEKKVKAPYLPKCQSDTDISHFSSYYTEELVRNSDVGRRENDDEEEMGCWGGVLPFRRSTNQVSGRSASLENESYSYVFSFFF